MAIWKEVKFTRKYLVDTICFLPFSYIFFRFQMVGKISKKKPARETPNRSMVPKKKAYICYSPTAMSPSASVEKLTGCFDFVSFVSLGSRSMDFTSRVWIFAWSSKGSAFRSRT